MGRPDRTNGTAFRGVGRHLLPMGRRLASRQAGSYGRVRRRHSRRVSSSTSPDVGQDPCPQDPGPDNERTAHAPSDNPHAHLVEVIERRRQPPRTAIAPCRSHPRAHQPLEQAVGTQAGGDRPGPDALLIRPPRSGRCRRRSGHLRSGPIVVAHLLQRFGQPAVFLLVQPRTESGWPGCCESVDLEQPLEVRVVTVQRCRFLPRGLLAQDPSDVCRRSGLFVRFPRFGGVSSLLFEPRDQQRLPPAGVQQVFDLAEQDVPAGLVRVGLCRVEQRADRCFAQLMRLVRGVSVVTRQVQPALDVVGKEWRALDGSLAPSIRPLRSVCCIRATARSGQ